MMTDHAQALITIDIAEADDAVPEKVRQEMAEPYRTILGVAMPGSTETVFQRTGRCDLIMAKPVVPPQMRRLSQSRASPTSTIRPSFRGKPLILRPQKKKVCAHPGGKIRAEYRQNRVE